MSDNTGIKRLEPAMRGVDVAIRNGTPLPKEPKDCLCQAVVRTEHLCKTYPDGRVNALIDVSLEIPAGQYVAIMGPSGSGKSTMLNLLGALDRPSQGEVFFEGKPLSTMKDLDKF